MSRSQINHDEASLIFQKSQSIIESKYHRKHEHEHVRTHEHVLSSAITSLIADGTRTRGSHRGDAKTFQMDDIPPPSSPIPIRVMRSSSINEDDVRSNADSNTNTNTNTNSPATPTTPVPHTSPELLLVQHRTQYSRSSSFYDGARTVTAAVQHPNNTTREQWNILIRMLRKDLLLIHLQDAYLTNLLLKRSQERSSMTSSYSSSSSSSSFFLRTETSVSTNDISRYSSNKDDKDDEGRDDVEGRVGYNDWHLSPVISCLGSPTKELSFSSLKTNSRRQIKSCDISRLRSSLNERIFVGQRCSSAANTNILEATVTTGTAVTEGTSKIPCRPMHTFRKSVSLNHVDFNDDFRILPRPFLPSDPIHDSHFKVHCQSQSVPQFQSLSLSQPLPQSSSQSQLQSMSQSLSLSQSHRSEFDSHIDSLSKSVSHCRAPSPIAPATAIATTAATPAAAAAAVSAGDVTNTGKQKEKKRLVSSSFSISTVESPALHGDEQGEAYVTLQKPVRRMSRPSLERAASYTEGKSSGPFSFSPFPLIQPLLPQLPLLPLLLPGKESKESKENDSIDTGCTSTDMSIMDLGPKRCVIPDHFFLFLTSHNANSHLIFFFYIVHYHSYHLLMFSVLLYNFQFKF
jgi:hypothetical protein